jgi:hypothetical protein
MLPPSACKWTVHLVRILLVVPMVPDVVTCTRCGISFQSADIIRRLTREAHMSKLTIELDEDGTTYNTKISIDGEVIGGIQKVTLISSATKYSGSMKIYILPGNERFLKLLEPFKKWLTVIQQ